MLAYENGKLLLSKKRFRAKAIKKILIDDDILKIEYLNKHGENADIMIANPKHPDIEDIENFLFNIVPSYRAGQLKRNFLIGYGKSLYYQLTTLIDPDYTGFGKIESIRFGRFIIEQAFEQVVHISLAEKQKTC